MLIRLLRLFARLPLPLIHACGTFAGWCTYLGTSRYAERIQRNLKASGVAADQRELRRLLRRNVAELGKGMVESFAIWLRPHTQALRWVRTCHGWEHVEAALQQKRGIIFLTPHLGCFEITSQYYSAYHPITVLYRPPRQAWLAPLIEEGRERGLTTLAPTNVKGVRSLLRALKQGEAVGILPDQNPGKGEGEWADFFGRPAYTMTLVNRLAEATNAAVLLAFGERLPWGRGYAVHFEPLAEKPEPAAINAAIERLVRRKPEQYLWSYPRHRRPKGVPPP